ncbi:hypothetical protein EDB87DRAFT_1684309 [Lactarius vividus]|nr:hypothetical protein EDB87DRAFT_1684309 [Lactarius vividus]
MIRCTTVDPERRLKAIEASQKNRERELADRADEFEEELKGRRREEAQDDGRSGGGRACDVWGSACASWRGLAGAIAS